MENGIEIVTNPVIKHKLDTIGKQVTERIKGLNLESQVVTEDTVQAIKKLRAELNKEKADFDAQLKLVTDTYNKPFTEVKDSYKVNITDAYGKADSLLKDKIGSFELILKTEKKNNVIAYFNELCASVNIDFLEFKNLDIDINLTITEKKYKEQVSEYIKKVIDDLKLIETEEYYSEILVLYKQTLNCSNSIISVKNRKGQELIETKRIKEINTQKKISALVRERFSYDEFSKSYQFNESIYVTSPQIEELTTQEFSDLLDELIDKIKAIKTPVTPFYEGEQAFENDTNKPIEVKATLAIPLPSPKEVVKEEICTASFEVKGTMSQLRALGSYLKQNNLTYTNL